MNESDTILLAEDSDDDRLLIRHAFRKSAIKNPIIEAKDGEQAIAYLEGAGQYANRELYPLPCVIITDLKLPRLDGFGLLQWLQERPQFARIPKLVLSSSSLSADRTRAANLGACAYFVKPVGFDELTNTVSEINDDWVSKHCPLTT